MADMDIYVGMLHARQAAHHLLITHVERRNGNVVGEELNHRLAMEQLDKMAEALGLDLVPRADVVLR